ncbi:MULTISPECIES: class I SAM-dependent methyltransferase [Flavobacteriaceae]|uniref:2-polyprenyl-3-methyl-5-hydroxy-6-metoxy-1, 4-benzoquinol methylase n=1 Tax=Meridianimaribacter flavus TaxID=571115 RepID=A0ABY2G7Y1_9FLAO|nr:MULTISPECIES: class I SAM-dependent methyltransferase [Flavobacteriaceae]TDY13561.1 2-polyprenyl-3-methyl-5-hydroxy-6-metoxy-1,4-benzoquinol methylase [Meridianimaribacter flavus]
MNKKPTYLTVKDHSVSGEDFQLVYNEELDMLETTPQPSANTLSEYYKSEDYISHTDSKRNWFEKAYHFVRGMALKRKLKLINSFPVSGKTILDVGCGTGDFLLTAKNNAWNVYGIEPNEKARAIANSKTINQVFDTNTLQEFESGTFDVITLWHVLEHLPNLETEIQNLNRLLKPEGRLVIAVPNFKSYDAKHYSAFWAAYDVPRHLWHFSQTSISKLFSKHNLEIEKTLPMTFDAFYVSLLSEQYKSGSKNPLTAFWVGLQSNLKAKRTGEYSSLIYVLKKS